MADETLSTGESSRGQADEARIAKGIAIGLPLVTISVAAVVGVLTTAATSILVIAAGLLLGVIALLWGSLRVLSGDAPLSPELEALDMTAQGDALSSRKKMLLRALKDLENERSVGKIEDEDYEQLSSMYRSELKTVLMRIDETLAPYRTKAEEAARAHLARVGLAETGYRGEFPSDETEKAAGRDADVPAPAKASGKGSRVERVSCPSCGASNERDAKFCKECATKLGAAPKAAAPERAPSDEEVSNDT